MVDKREALKRAAHQMFSQKGYKATSIAQIAARAHVAVGSFYNYFPSKEAIFLEIYIEENNRARQQMIETIDWEADPITITGDLFDQVRTGVRDNRILAEWGNPALSGTLHAHFQSEAREEDYPFHQFLITTIATKLADAGFDEAEVARLLNVYRLVYFMDTHITESDFPGFDEALETLITHFVKGVFA